MVMVIHEVNFKKKKNHLSGYITYIVWYHLSMAPHQIYKALCIKYRIHSYFCNRYHYTNQQTSLL